MRALLSVISLFLLTTATVWAGSPPDCQLVAQGLNQQLDGKLNPAQLADVLSTLNRRGHLPDYFINKRAARAAGWRPGTALGQIPQLADKHIGGDRFANFERRLPQGQWREADLNYRGGKRGAQRLVFEAHPNGRRYISIDHYQTFYETPACR